MTTPFTHVVSENQRQRPDVSNQARMPPQTTYIPWNTELLAWLASNYYLLHSKQYIFIYARTKNP